MAIVQTYNANLQPIGHRAPDLAIQLRDIKQAFAVLIMWAHDPRDGALAVLLDPIYFWIASS